MTKKSEETKNATLYINNYPKSLCRERNGTGRPFFSVSFQRDSEWCSFIVPSELVRKSRKKDFCLNENCVTITLGSADEIRAVSIAHGENDYEEIEMSNNSILEAVNASREAYAMANA